jgi:hypothetical protein
MPDRPVIALQSPGYLKLWYSANSLAILLRLSALESVKATWIYENLRSRVS